MMQARMSLQGANLQQLLLRHEIAFCLLVLVAGVIGVSGTWTAYSYSLEQQRIHVQALDTQSVAVQLQDALLTIAHAAAMQDFRALDNNSLRLDEIGLLFRNLLSRSQEGNEITAVEHFQKEFRDISEDLLRLRLAGPSQREALRLKLLGQKYRKQALMRFSQARIALLEELEAAQKRLDQRLDSILAITPWLAIAILVGVVQLVRRSRHLVRKELREPLAILTAQAQKLQVAEEQDSVPVIGVAEVRELTTAFNEMNAALSTAKSQLESHTRDSALSSLVPVVAHNVRNPLASIRAAAQVLDKNTDSAELEDIKAELIATVDRLERWIGALLSYLGPQSLNHERINLRDLLAGIIALSQDKALRHHVQLQMKCTANPIYVEADRSLLEQALYGLLVNAIEASPAGQTVCIAIEDAGSVLKCSISDAGPGMPFEPNPRDLLPGPTTKRLGCGLGIPFAYKTIQAHTWTIWHEPVLPTGTRVVVNALRAA